MYCLCVNVYCHRLTTQFQLTNTSYHISLHCTYFTLFISVSNNTVSTYNLTLGGGAFLQPLLQCTCNEYYIFWVCVCSLRYLACNAHAPYCHMWSTPLYSIFPPYLVNGTIFVKTLLNIKCVFWFSLQHLSETFVIVRRNERDIIKNVYRSSCKVPVIVVQV